MKAGRFAIVLGLALTVASGARNFAHAEGHEPPAGEGETHGGGSHEGPIFVRNSPTTVGSGHTPHERPAREGQIYGSTKPNGGPFRDPIIGQNSAGRNVVKENPNNPNMRGTPYANKGQVATAHEHKEDFEQPRGVTLISTSGKGPIAGLNAGPFKDGRANVLDGHYGEVNVDVLRVDREYSAGVGIGNGNVQAQAGGRVVATLVGVHAETKNLTLGDPNGINNAMGQLEARAYIGADAEGNISAHAGKDGIGGQAEAGAFAGGKAEVQGAGTVTICGVAVNLTGVAEASYGIGAKASGAFDINWSTMTVRVGLKGSLTVGGGLGAGGTVEISLDKVLRNPEAAAKCVADHLLEAGKFVVEKGGELVDGAVNLGGRGIDALGRGADAVSSTISDAGHGIANFFGFGGRDNPPPTRPIAVGPTPGSNVSRNSPTTPTASATGASTPGAGGAGDRHGIER